MLGELRERAKAFAFEAHKYTKEVDKVRKALEALATEAAWADGAQRKRCIKAIVGASELRAPVLDAFGEALQQGSEQFASELRRTFLDALVAEVERRKLAWQSVGQQPPVLDLAGISVTLDWDKECAALAYGREPLAKVSLVVGEVLSAREEQIDRLRSVWPGPDVFFAALDSAYRARAGREAKRPGERVHLVDLIPELLVEYELRGLRSPKTIFGRAELAYCLDRLAREGGLEQGQRRLELGTATGGSTKDKRQVLFLQAGMGGGQYYLSVCVAPTSGDGGRS